MEIIKNAQRYVVTPTTKTLSIPVPENMMGKEIEIIILPLHEVTNDSTFLEDSEKKP